MRAFSSIAILSILLASVSCFADSNLVPEYSDPWSNPENDDSLLNLENNDPLSNPEFPDPLSNSGPSDPSLNNFPDGDSGNLASALPGSTSTDAIDENGDILVDDHSNLEPLLLASGDCKPNKTNRKRGGGLCPPGFSRPDPMQAIEQQEGNNEAATNNYPHDLPVNEGSKVTAPGPDNNACSDQGSGYTGSRTPMCHDGVHGLVKLKKSRGVNLYGGHFYTPGKECPAANPTLIDSAGYPEFLWCCYKVELGNYRKKNQDALYVPTLNGKDCYHYLYSNHYVPTPNGPRR